jgi:hypothetical protein
MNNSNKEPALPVTNSGPRPGDFPVGSLQSRAAARAMMERKQDEGMRVFIVNGNEAVPGPRRQDLVIRICNTSEVAENRTEPLSETSTRYCCMDGTVREASLPSNAAAPQERMEEPEPVAEQPAEHVPLAEARRRPLVRPRPRRFRWPPSAYGL